MRPLLLAALSMLPVLYACVGSDPDTTSTPAAADGGTSGETGAASGTTVACTQKPGADTDKECADRSDKPRKLDCSTAEETDSAIAAGCVRTSSGASDVCCPTTVRGTGDGDPTPGGTAARATWALSLGDSSDCTSLPTLTFGSFSPEVLIANGESVGGSTASVVCSVKPAQSGFTISALASKTGDSSVQVVGPLNASSPPGTVTGTFIWPDGTTFTRPGCTVTYPASGGIAAGRVWGKMDCPAVGSSIPDKCIAHAQFRFENCAQ